MALISVSYASTVDLSAMTNDEIIALLGQVNQEIVSRGIQKSASLPAGKYVGGKDLPVGALHARQTKIIMGSSGYLQPVTT